MGSDRIYFATEGVVFHTSNRGSREQTKQVSDDLEKWADRVAQVRIRRLYRCAVLGIYDEEALQQVGAALYARCVDIAAVADAFSWGKVPCPKCDGKVERRIDPLYRLEGHGAQSSWFRCSACDVRLLWDDCRKTLREHPRCFTCGGFLAGTTMLRCDCGKEWSRAAYQRSVGRRVRLPCPACHALVRRPVVRKDESSTSQGLKLRCPECDGMALHEGGEIRCDSCGFRRRWRDFRRALKGRDEGLECPNCGHAFTWQKWRKSAQPLRTGNPQPARDFVQSWPNCRTPQGQMIQIDSLLQKLHGQGPLAPLFIEGDEASIRTLLDELASQEGPSR